MIRVVARHIDHATGHLIGDFPPGQINDLVQHFREFRVYDASDLGETDDLRLMTPNEAGASLQWVLTDEARPRWILELILEDDR